MGRWRVVRLVARREIRERLRSNGFRVATAIMVAGAVGAGVVPTFLDDDEHPIQVGVVGVAPAALPAAVRFAAGDAGQKVDVAEFATVAEADDALRAGKAHVVVEVGGDLHVRGEHSSDRALEFAHRLAAAIPLHAGLESAGVPAERIDALLSPAPLPVRAIEPPREDRGSRDAVFFGTLVLYMALITYGGWVATGVLEEKSSRVVEVVLSALRPPQLLAGKVIGIGLLGLGQLTLVGAAGLAAAVLAGVDLPSSVSGAAGLVLVCFVLGFAFYSCVFAALGAAASRQEDAQSAMGPLIALLVGVFFLSTFVQADPDGALARIGSFVPPLAPMTVPARVLLGHPPLWELLASITLTVAATYGLIRLGARAYGGAVLRFGPKLALRDLWGPSLAARSRAADPLASR